MEAWVAQSSGLGTCCEKQHVESKEPTHETVLSCNVTPCPRASPVLCCPAPARAPRHSPSPKIHSATQDVMPGAAAMASLPWQKHCTVVWAQQGKGPGCRSISVGPPWGRWGWGLAGWAWAEGQVSSGNKCLETSLGGDVAAESVSDSLAPYSQSQDSGPKPQPGAPKFSPCFCLCSLHPPTGVLWG